MAQNLTDRQRLNLLRLALVNLPPPPDATAFQAAVRMLLRVEISERAYRLLDELAVAEVTDPPTPPG